MAPRASTKSAKSAPADPRLQEINRKWNNLLALTVRIFGVDGQRASSNVSTRVQAPGDLGNGYDMATLGAKSFGPDATRWAAKGLGGLAGKWAAIAWDVIEGVGFVRSMGRENLGDVLAMGGEWVAGRVSLPLAARVAGGGFAVAWTTFEAFQFGMALGAEMEMGNILERRLKDAYFSFMNRALWIPYGYALADQRAEANEYDVTRPKALRPGVGGQIFQIEQDINGFLYRYGTTWRLPRAEQDALLDWFADNPGLANSSFNRTEKVNSVLTGWIAQRLNEIDAINLDMNSWEIP